MHLSTVVCSYKPKAGNDLLFPDAQIGKKYYGVLSESRSSEFSIPPQYEFISSAHGLYFLKKYGEKYYQTYDPKTKKFSKTKIGQIIETDWKHRKRWQSEPKDIQVRKATGLFSPDRTILYKYSDNGVLVGEIKNVAGNPKTDFLPSALDGRIVAQKIKNNTYWTVFDEEGMALSPAIKSTDMKFITHHYGGSQFLRVPYEKLGNFIYRPLFASKNEFINGWDNDMGFVLQVV